MTAPLPRAKNGSAKSTPDVTVIEIVETESRRTTLVALGILLVFALAIATYVGIKHSLKEVRGEALQAQLDAELRAFEVWVQQKSGLAERWAKDEETRAVILSLMAASVQPGASAENVCGSQEAMRLREIFRPALTQRRFETYNVIDRGGLVVAAFDSAHCGQRVSTRKFLGHLDRTFSGQVSFLRPFRETDRLPDLASPRYAQPQVWFEAPVADARGRVVAALGFAEPAAWEFASLLRVPASGQTDEIFLFDERGLLLSDSRHADKLAAVGALKNPASSTTMLQVEVRIPVKRNGDSSPSAGERSSQPLTQLVREAVASQSSNDPKAQRGLLLEPYLNYYGAEAVGAWRWLAQYDLGAALEIEVEEAFAPVKFLDRAFSIVLGLSAAAAVGIVIALLTNFRLRQGLGSVKRLGRYTLLREIGEGGMASVFLGRHALLKRPIAIKILKRALANEEMIVRFEREVQLASQLTHPNTIEIYDYGRTRGGDFYYVMEYLDGITLAALVARDGALGAARTIYLIRQVCAALKEAHARGIVHRDIKPENIMACVRGGEFDVVKILDFGLVKSMADEVSRDITHSVKVLGTPAYMAPERFSQGSAVDERADIYALGAVAYLLLSGKRIFDDASGDDLQLRILSTPVPPPSQVAAQAVPTALEELILRCMAKKPVERPATVVEVMVTLEQLALSYPWSQAEAERWWQGYKEGESNATE